jgi:exodeoxyribonuclease-5
MLGMREDPLTGEFIRKERKDYEDGPPIEDADIIMIDEASMVNEQILELIYEHKKPNAKVIFLGDIGQLPPIRTQSNQYYKNRQNLFGKDSPVFDGKNKSKLITRVRQGEESPILPFADNFWLNSRSNNPVENPAKGLRENAITDKGAILFTPMFNNIKTQIVDAFRKGLEDKNDKYIKVVTYRNATREAVNDYIHNTLFGKDSVEYNDGELIMFNASFGENIANSDEGRVVSAEGPIKDSETGVSVFELAVHVNNDIEMVSVVAKEDQQKWKDYLNQQRAIYQNLYRTKDKGAGLAFREFKKKESRYANLDYAYAITSHKSQGSTYDMVVVDEKDIMSVGATDNKTKSQAIYTALTRARNISVIISSESTNAEPSNMNDVNANIEANKGDTRGTNQQQEATEEISNEIVLSDNSILTLPNESTNVDLGPRGNFTMNTNGSIVNNSTKNVVVKDSPIYFNVIAKYQEDQANDEQNKCN